MKLERLGTQYGGWIIPVNVLTPSSVVYSAGVGEDISFDQAVSAKYGCVVYAFDPTPRASEYVWKLKPIQFNFHPWGLASNDGERYFHAPENPKWVSHSIYSQKAASGFKAQCFSLKTIMEKLGHTHIDLLKLDIEGAEYEVLDHLPILPKMICVEFHDRLLPAGSNHSKASTMVKLARLKYEMVSEKQNDCLFVRRGD